MLSSTFLKFTSINLAGGNAGAGTNDISNLVIVRVHGGGKIDVNGRQIQLTTLKQYVSAMLVTGKMKIAVKALDGAKMQDVVDTIESLGQDQTRDIFVVK